MKYEISIVIGRFQPIHKAHIELIKTAQDLAEKPIIMIGSANKFNTRNPFSSTFREELIRSCFDDNLKDTSFIHQHDYESNAAWKENLLQNIGAISPSKIIVLVGHKHDQSSFYMDLFPEWDVHNINNIDEIPHATELRKMYYTGSMEYKKYVNESVFLKLEAFKETGVYQKLVDMYKGE